MTTEVVADEVIEQEVLELKDVVDNGIATAPRLYGVAALPSLP
jgi:hypothetical protein